MKYTRKARRNIKGGDPLFIPAPTEPPQRLSEMIGVRDWRDPVAQQSANNLMKKNLFNIGKIKSSGHLPVNKQKIKNFAQNFASRIVQRGPNGKPRILVQNKNTIKKNLHKFSRALGFTPQTPRPVKNFFGNPTFGENPLTPPPGTNPWQIQVGPQSGWHFGVGGKLRTVTRKRGIARPWD